jgi:hypothetical protein
MLCHTVQVFEVAGDVLQPQLGHNLCRLVAEQDSELHTTAVQVGFFESSLLACWLHLGMHGVQRGCMCLQLGTCACPPASLSYGCCNI